MKNMSKFQLALTIIFGFFILAGVLVFALGRTTGTKEISKVTIWGTMSSNLFSRFVHESGLDKDQTVAITYVEKKKDTFDTEFVEALATGKGPDLFFLPQDSILKHKDKIVPIPFKSYPERTFKDTFVEEGELFITPEGIMGIPFIIDPMVMYWNRDIFSNAGLSLPPKYWTEVYDLSTRLTKKDTNLNITDSFLAFGEYGNISNADEIISLLVMQAGNPITTRDPNTGALNNLFDQRLATDVLPTERAVNFYTEFSNPLKPFYSWNRSLPESKSFFLSGNLAVYFGFASELADIRLKNPNLNFDIAQMPQPKDSGKTITFGRMIALAIPRSSPNIAAAFRVATILTNAQNIQTLTDITHLPPVRRDLAATKPNEAYLSLFFSSAVQSRAWISPEKAKISPIFKEMIESVTAGRANTSQAITRAGQRLDSLLK